MKTFIALLALAAVAVAAPSGPMVQLVVNINAADLPVPDVGGNETPEFGLVPVDVVDTMPVIVVPVMPEVDQIVDVMPVVNPEPALPPAIELPTPALPVVIPPVVPDAAVNLPEILN